MVDAARFVIRNWKTFKRVVEPILLLMAAKYAALGLAAFLSGAKQAAGWALAKAGAIAAGIINAILFPLEIARWLALGTMAMAQGLKIAAAWVIAGGPPVWIAAAIALAVAAIIVYWDDLKDAAEAVKDWILEKFNAIVEFFGDLPGRILDAVGDLSGLLVDAGAALIGGLVSGIESALGGLSGAVGWVVGKLGDLAGGSISVPPLVLGGGGVSSGSISRFAAGGVITRPTFGLLGETAGARPEIVTPEGLLRTVFRDELDRRGRGGGSTVVSIQIDGREFARAVGTPMRERLRRLDLAAG